MSRSIPAGGQITPFDWASFSLKWSRTATAHGWRLALDVRRACYPLLGGRVLGRLRQTTPARAKPTNAAMIRMVSRKRQFLTHLRSVFVNVPRRNTFPPPTAEGPSGHLTFAQKAVAVSGSAAT